MKGEINRDWYCSANSYRTTDKLCCIASSMSLDSLRCRFSWCRNFHRKWPTPEQFEEEYGENYPDSGVVLVCKTNYRSAYYEPMFYGQYKKYKNGGEIDWEDEPHVKVLFVVCACTPWGKPPNGWRPE